MFNLGRNILLLLVLAMPGLVSAGLSDFDRTRLSDQIELAAQNLDPNLLPRLDDSKPEVLNQIERTKEFFRRTTSERNSAAWMAYLDLEPLTQSIQAGDSIGAINRDALALRYRLVGTYPGLELTVLRNLRHSVEQLLASIRFREPDKSIPALNKQLVSLAERIRNLDPQPSAEDGAAISAMIDILKTSGQASDVVFSLRDTFSRPNAAVLVSEQIVQTAISQNVNQTSPVNDCILGTRIIGTATMNGAVTANLLPSVGAARIQVALTGTVHSNNTGYNGPVRVQTSGVGNVHASRTMTVNEAGVSFDPVTVLGSMQTQINSIHPKRKLGSRLVKKIARKRAAQQKPQTDRIANYKLRTRIGEQFTAQTDEQANLDVPDFMRDVRPMLKRLSLVEPLRFWGSTDNNLYIDATMRRDDQMLTVVSRPTITGPFAAAVQIHESAVNNAATPILAGRTVNEKQLNDLLEATGRELPTDDPNGDDADENRPFEISFARLRPIIFEARNQRVRVGVRGTRFAQGSRELDRAMEITATYEPGTLADGSVILLRVGDVGVDFPGRKRLSVSQAGLKATIQKKFSRIFPETLLDRPLEVPQTAELEAIRGRVFRPRVVDAKNGWLTIAVK